MTRCISFFGNIAIKNKDTNDANNPAKKAGTLLSPRFFAMFIAISAGIRLKIKPINITGINDKTKSLNPPFLKTYVESTIIKTSLFLFNYTIDPKIYNTFCMDIQARISQKILLIEQHK